MSSSGTAYKLCVECGKVSVEVSKYARGDRVRCAECRKKRKDRFKKQQEKRRFREWFLKAREQTG